MLGREGEREDKVCVCTFTHFSFNLFNITHGQIRFFALAVTQSVCLFDYFADTSSFGL